MSDASSDFRTIDLPYPMTGQEVIDFVREKFVEEPIPFATVASDPVEGSSFVLAIQDGKNGYNVVIGSQEGETHIPFIELGQMYSQINLYPTNPVIASREPMALSMEYQLGYVTAVLTDTVMSFIMAGLRAVMTDEDMLPDLAARTVSQKFLRLIKSFDSDDDGLPN